MSNSSTVSSGEQATASQYNNLRDDVLSTSSGHLHDGSTGRNHGNFVIGLGAAGTDYTLTFNGESNDGVITWDEDNDYFKFSDDILINSTERVNFYDTGLYIYSSTDGQLDIVADTELAITAPTVDIDASTEVNISTDLKVGDDLSLTSDSSVFNMGAGNDFTITHDGTTGATIAGTPISIDSTGELHLNSTTGDIKLQDGGTDQIAFDLDGTSGVVIIKPMVDSDDLVIQQYDGTEVLRIEDGAYLNVSNTTASSSATTGSAIFGGGIGVAADAYVGDDLYLISDSAVLGFGADKDTTLTHTDGTGLTLNSTNKLTFGDAASYIAQSSDGTLRIDGEAIIDLNASTRVDVSHALTVGTDVNIGDDLSLTSDSAVFNMGDGNDFTITHDGTTGATIAGNPIIVDSGGQIELDSHTGILTFEDGGTEVLRFTEGNSGDVTIKLVTNGKDLIFTDNGDATNMKILDAAAGINVPGEVQTTGIGYTDGDNAMTIADGGAVTFPVSIDVTGSAGIILENDETITNSTNGYVALSGSLTIPNAGTIGSAGDADSIAIASDGVVTMNQIPVFSAGINVSGGTIAGTLATAAQTNITSLGTLTALQVDNLNLNGNTISSTNSDGDITISGNDGGSTVVAQHIDMSGGGITVFGGGTASAADTNTKMYQANAGPINILGTSSTDTAIAIGRWSNNASGGTLAFVKDRDGTIGDATALQDGDELGKIWFGAGDGVQNAYTYTLKTAQFSAYSDGATGNDGSGDPQTPSGFKWETNTGVAAANTAEVMRLNRYGQLLIGQTADPRDGGMGTKPGLIINQGTGDGPILAFSSDDIDHGMDEATFGFDTDHDNYAVFEKASHGAGGGLLIKSLGADGSNGRNMRIDSVGGTADTTKSTGGAGLIDFYVSEHDGSDGLAAVAANGNVFAIRANVGGSHLTRFIIDEDGDIYAAQDATTGLQTIDEYDDAHLVRAFDLAKDGKGLVKDRWDDFVKYNEKDLIEVGVLGDTLENGGLVNVTGLQRLHNGAIWQGYVKQNEMQERIHTLESRLLALESK